MKVTFVGLPAGELGTTLVGFTTDGTPRHPKPYIQRPYPMVAPKHLPEPQTTKMKRANNQGPTDAFSSGAFLCKNENSLFKCKTPLGPRAPAAYTLGQVAGSSHLTGFLSVPEPPSSSTHLPEPPPPNLPPPT